MLISCKVSNSVLSYLERQGRDLSPLWGLVDVSEDYLRDPACWLEAPKMESLLKEIDLQFRDLPEGFAREVGKQNDQLRAWGVLDSVLKMVESPVDIYNQPSRFISYFISPQPPIAAWRQDGDVISFQLPVMTQQYPMITEYLAGALEGLPAYMRQPPSVVEWEDSEIRIAWRKTQESLLADEDLQLRQFNPQWVRSMMDALERHQKNLQNQTVPTVEGEGISSAELKELQSFLGDSSAKFEWILNDVVATKNDFLKLHDYFARSQQLITFLVNSGRRTKQVDEAMRRMDWKHVQESYDLMVQSACDRILKSRASMQELLLDFKKFAPQDDVTSEPASQDLQLPI